ncbi:hypothetical protein KBD45_01610 [Candidatus Dojkabacteria bacterium]|nr:hypothetical protein [Candidatus Dojkabacteria bacterium]
MDTNLNYVPNTNFDYNFQISELQNENIIISRQINMGSGGGALYNVYRLPEKGNLYPIKSEIYACSGPIVDQKDGLIFKNNGKHCSWFDSGGTPEIIKVNLN